MGLSLGLQPAGGSGQTVGTGSAGSSSTFLTQEAVPPHHVGEGGSGGGRRPLCVWGGSHTRKTKLPATVQRACVWGNGAEEVGVRVKSKTVYHWASGGLCTHPEFLRHLHRKEGI